MNVSPAGTIAEITSRLKKYSEAVKHQYLTHTVRNDEIHFWDRATQPSFEAMVCVDSDLIYAAEVIDKSIISFQIERDGVGVKGMNVQAIVPYRTTWRKVNSMCLNNGNLFLSHGQGISTVNLETCEYRLAVELTNQPCVLTSFGEDVLYTNQTKASTWQLSGNGNDLRLFAGSDEEEGSTDGPVKECRFKQPVGICSEFESVVYVCDAQTLSNPVPNYKNAHTFSKQLAVSTKPFPCTTEVLISRSSLQKKPLVLWGSAERCLMRTPVTFKS